MPTREILVGAARRVFRARSFHDSKVSDIVDLAGVSHGTFYTYFGSKEDVFAAVVQDLDTEVRALPPAPARSDGADPRAEVAEATRTLYRFAHTNARLLISLEQLANVDERFQRLHGGLRSALLERQEHSIQAWQLEGWADPALDPARAAEVLGGMVERVAHLERLAGASESRLLPLVERAWSATLLAPHPTA